MAEPYLFALNCTFKGIALGIYRLPTKAGSGTPEPVATVFAAQSHSAALRLPELSTELLTKAGLGWNELAGIAVAHGPGSFTGIKIGLSFVQGLAAGGPLPVLGFDPLACLGRFGSAANRCHSWLLPQNRPWLLPQNRRKGYLYPLKGEPKTVWLPPSPTERQELWLAPLGAATADDPRRTAWPQPSAKAGEAEAGLHEVGLVTPWPELIAALPDGVATVAADPERFGLAALAAMAAAFAERRAAGRLPVGAQGLKANYITPSTPEERQIAAAHAAAQTAGKTSDGSP